MRLPGRRSRCKEELVYPSERKRMEQVAEFATKAFERHVIIQNVSQGLYRHWRCSRPDSGMYAFNVITEPGRLIVTGDLGELILCRCPDMVEFVRSAIRDLHYLSSKAEGTPTHEWSDDVARDWVDAEVTEIHAEMEADEPLSEESKKKYAVRLEKYREVRESIDEGEHSFDHALYESRLTDGCDWPRVRTYSCEFLWIVEALRWFLARVPAPVQAAEGQ